MAQEVSQDTAALTLVIEKLSEICRRPTVTPALPTPTTPVVQASLDVVDSPSTNVVTPVNTQTIYHCKQCGYTSHNKYYLRQHLDLVHNSTRPYKCPFCDYAGKRSYALKEHLIVHSSDRPHECVHCHATFRKKGHLSNHLKMHASQLVCTICKVTCRGKQQLLAHLQQQHSRPGQQVYACDQCLFASINRTEMMNHLQRHTDPKPVWLKCSVCGFSCSGENEMHGHMLENHLEDAQKDDDEESDDTISSLYVCAVCDFTTEEQSKMDVHMMTHQTPTDNNAKDNNDVTQSDNSSDNASQFTFNTESRMFACTICNYTCDQQRTIKSHIWKHSGHKDILYPMFEKVPAKKSADSSNTIGSQTQVEAQSPSITVEALVARRERQNVTAIVVPDSSKRPKTVKYARPKNVKIAPKPAEPETSLPIVTSHPLPDIAKEAAIIAKLAPPDDAIITTVSPSKSPNGQRKRRASDSEISNKRSRVESPENLDPNPTEKVVVLTNENCGMDEILLAIAAKESENLDGTRSVKEAEEVKKEKEEKSQPPQSTIVTRSKRGICSSLLAVIEQQLQEKRDTESTPNTTSENESKKTKLKPVTRHFSNGYSVTVTFEDTNTNTAVDETPNSKENEGLGWDKNNLEQLEDGHYRCRLCHYQSLQFTLIAQHMKLHKIKRPHECSLCDFVAKNSVTLQEHMLQHCKVRTYQCKTCGATFNYKSQLRAHCRMHEEKTKIEGLVCEWCDHVSSDVATFRSHVKTHEKEDRPICQEPVVEAFGTVGTGVPAIDGVPDEVKAAVERVTKIPVVAYSRLGSTRVLQTVTPAMMQNAIRIIQPQQMLQLQQQQQQQLQQKQKLLQQTKVQPKQPIQSQQQQQPLKVQQQETVQTQQQDVKEQQKLQQEAKQQPEVQQQTSEQKLQPKVPEQPKLQVQQNEQQPAKLQVQPNLQPVQQQQIQNLEQLIPMLQQQQQKQVLIQQQQQQQPTLQQIRIQQVAPLQQLSQQPHVQQPQVQQILVPSPPDDKADQLHCTQCEFRAISVRSLKSHMKRHTNDQRFVEKPLEQYKCTMCGYVCHHLPSLKSHMWRHASDTTYSYNKANDVINAAIDRDVITSDEEGVETFLTFRCVVCGFESTDRNKLTVHMREHQDVIDKTLEV